MENENYNMGNIIISANERQQKKNLMLSLVMILLFATCRVAKKGGILFPALRAGNSLYLRATERSRTADLIITSELLYQTELRWQ